MPASSSLPVPEPVFKGPSKQHHFACNHGILLIKTKCRSKVISWRPLLETTRKRRHWLDRFVATLLSSSQHDRYSCRNSVTSSIRINMQRVRIALLPHKFQQCIYNAKGVVVPPVEISCTQQQQQQQQRPCSNFAATNNAAKFLQNSPSTAATTQSTPATIRTYSTTRVVSCPSSKCALKTKTSN